MQNARWAPRSTVAVVCKNPQEQYLIVRERINGKLVINQPAGHLDPDETLIEAALRETLEETGWRVEITDYLGLYCYKTASGIQFHRHCFIATPVEQRSTLLDPAIDSAEWLSLEALTKEEGRMRSPMVLGCIRDYLRGKSYPLSIISEC